jgi:hypothetical protein
MKNFVLLSKLICLIIFLCLSIKSYQLITDGFRIDKIKFEPFLEKIAIEDNFFEVENILNQKFKYLSKGCQTYVFESEDKKYVLKFIRYHRYHPYLWLKIFKNKYFLNNYYTKLKNHKDKLFVQSINSYQIANDYLKNETKTLYIHLNQTNNLNKKVVIIDRLNQKFEINLDEYGFILQKKANSLSKHLKNSLNNENHLKDITNSFINLTDSIYKKGFINSDYNCIKNSGIIENEIIFTDLGSFKKTDNLNEKTVYKKEMNKFMKYYQKWTDRYSPELTNYLIDEIDRLVNEN